jgi:DNA-binding NtrC family response regulator
MEFSISWERSIMSEDITTKILIVDDVPANLRVLREVLEPEGYRIFGASNGDAALRIATRVLPDIILLDIVMPGMDGYEVCRRLKQNESTEHIPVIFITVRDENVSLVEGFRAGGVDYITKPFDEAELLVRVENHLKISRLTQELIQKNEELEKEIARRQQAEDARQRADERFSLISRQETSRWGIEGFIGKSRTVRKILEDIPRLHHADTTGVLITGESGTGKELIARAIHSGGARANGPFIPVNCSAVPRELAESTFFGHVRGAFSGAATSRKGYFELADGGTLFLDEVGDMPLELQPKLLRVIEDGRVMPVGGSKERQVDVRIIAATNQSLTEKITEGAFREDLYFRLARFTVEVPPLRERKEDIPLLAQHFIGMFSVEMGVPQPDLSLEALNLLQSYHFPGNVRELKNVIEHALIKSNGESMIKPKHLHFIDASSPPVSTTSTPALVQINENSPDLEHIEETVIQRAQKTSDEGVSSDVTDEEKILDYIREHGSISNSECRELISSDRHRATYLLQKMHRYGLLVREGELRWARYRLP